MEPYLANYKAIIFDMDGTLVDSLKSHFDAWEIALNHFGIPFNQQFIHSLSGTPSINIAEKLCTIHGAKADPKELALYKFHTWEQLNPTPNLIPATAKIFYEHLERIPLAVGTGAKRESAELLLENVGLLNQLTALVTASDVQNGKPSGETFYTAARIMDIEPCNCVVFEDTDIGKQAAHDAEMDCYLITPSGFRYYPFESKS